MGALKRVFDSTQGFLPLRVFFPHCVGVQDHLHPEGTGGATLAFATTYFFQSF